MKPAARWTLWALLSASAFALLEGYALRHHRPSETLTASLRAVLGVHPQRGWRWIMIPALLAGLGWLVVHLLGREP